MLFSQLPSASFGNSDRHSGQGIIFEVFHMVLGSWWEIFENGGRGSTQNFAAGVVSIVVLPGELGAGEGEKTATRGESRDGGNEGK